MEKKSRKVDSKKFCYCLKFWLWPKKTWSLIGISATIATLYISFYSISVADYNLNFSLVSLERTSIENLVTNGNLEAALRRYRTASLVTLRNRPNFLIPIISWIPWWFWSSTPNREPLWFIIRSELNRHARDYILGGYPAIRGGAWGSGGSPGTPDKYLGINLAYADLRDVKLSGCDFTLVDLYRADLRGADLRGSDLSRAFLLETDLRYCNLRAFPHETNQPTRLNVAEDNQSLYEKATSQFIARARLDLMNNRRFRIEGAKIDSSTLLK